MCSGTYSPKFSDASQRFAGDYAPECSPSPHPVYTAAGSPFVLERTLPDPGIPTYTTPGRGGGPHILRTVAPARTAYIRFCRCADENVGAVDKGGGNTAAM